MPGLRLEDLSVTVKCCICQDDWLREGGATVTPCGHVFHRKCFARWTKTQRNALCPTCRAPTTMESSVKLYFTVDENVNAQQKLKKHLEKTERYRTLLNNIKKQINQSGSCAQRFSMVPRNQYGSPLGRCQSSRK